MVGRQIHSFIQTENSYIVGIEPGISRTEVRVLTTYSLSICMNKSVDYYLSVN